MSQVTKHADANTAAVVAQVEAQSAGQIVANAELMGQTPATEEATRATIFAKAMMANPMLTFVNRPKLDPKKLPKQNEVIDNKTGRPAKAVPFRWARGNAVVGG